MLDDSAPLATLNHAGRRVAYRHLSGPADRPGLLFLHGFRSDMTASKALHVMALARRLNIACTLFDYCGHGQSSKAFEDCDIGTWREDTLAVIDHVTTGRLVLVGSSMGGWMALLAARDRPGRVRGLIGIAAAPDFTEDLMRPRRTPEQAGDLARQGWTELVDAEHGPYRITARLLDSGRDHLVLRRPLPIGCPVRLIHGMLDSEVPWQTASRIAEAVVSEDVQVTLIKDAIHRLGRDEDLAVLGGVVESLLK